MTSVLGVWERSTKSQKLVQIPTMEISLLVRTQFWISPRRQGSPLALELRGMLRLFLLPAIVDVFLWQLGMIQSGWLMDGNGHGSRDIYATKKQTVTKKHLYYEFKK